MAQTSQPQIYQYLEGGDMAQTSQPQIYQYLEGGDMYQDPNIRLRQFAKVYQEGTDVQQEVLYEGFDEKYDYKIANGIWYTRKKDFYEGLPGEWRSLENNKAATDKLNAKYPSAIELSKGKGVELDDEGEDNENITEVVTNEDVNLEEGMSPRQIKKAYRKSRRNAKDILQKRLMTDSGLTKSEARREAKRLLKEYPTYKSVDAQDLVNQLYDEVWKGADQEGAFFEDKEVGQDVDLTEAWDAYKDTGGKLNWRQWTNEGSPTADADVVGEVVEEPLVVTKTEYGPDNPHPMAGQKNNVGDKIVDDYGNWISIDEDETTEEGDGDTTENITQEDVENKNEETKNKIINQTEKNKKKELGIEEDEEDAAFTLGDKIGMIGSGIGSGASLFTTIANRMGDKPAIPQMEDVSKRAEKEIQKTIKALNAEKAGTRASLMRTFAGNDANFRNAAQSWSQLRARKLANTTARGKAIRESNLGYDSAVAGQRGKLAETMFKGDVMAAQDRARVAQENKADRDAFYSNLGQDFQNLSQTAQKLGAGYNQKIQNAQGLESLNAMMSNFKLDKNNQGVYQTVYTEDGKKLVYNAKTGKYEIKE